MKVVPRRELPVGPVFLLLILLLSGVVTGDAQASDLKSTVQAARAYLRTEDPKERARLAEELEAFDGDRAKLVDALRPRPSMTVSPGYYPEEHFSDPVLREKNPDDLLYFQVPSRYDSARPNGLVVFMHGGGKGSPRTAPDRYMQVAEANTPQSTTRLGELFEDSGLIGVAPSAPWNEDDHSRWCLPEADEYLADVIHECKERFNIDDNRVFLMGHSMGGFGAYHQVQRQPDRFAAVVCSAGMWKLAHWPVIRGTKLFIVHGVQDAEYGVRSRSTDVADARWAHQLMDEQGIPNIFCPHPDGHSFGYAKSRVREFLDSDISVRNPSHPHVVLASPVGYTNSKCYPVRHNRWVTLESQKDGLVEYDTLRGSTLGADMAGPKEEWDRWQLTHHQVQKNGARIEAINAGNNQLRVKTDNVIQFSLWFDENMVDFDKDILIYVNGKMQFSGRLQPSITTLLESFDRRGDWSLVYPAKVTIDLEK